MYTQIEQRCADELAIALEDPHARSLYLTYAATVPHEVLREILTKVLDVPPNKIKRSRGALFTHLIELYKAHGTLHPRH